MVANIMGFLEQGIVEARTVEARPLSGAEGRLYPVNVISLGSPLAAVRERVVRQCVARREREQLFEAEDGLVNIAKVALGQGTVVERRGILGHVLHGFLSVHKGVFEEAAGRVGIRQDVMLARSERGARADPQ